MEKRGCSASPFHGRLRLPQPDSESKRAGGRPMERRAIMAESRDQGTTDSPPPFRLDVQLHDLLMQPAAKPATRPPTVGGPQKLPEPEFPSRPELQNGQDTDYRSVDGKRHWTVPQIMHALHGWALPYLKCP